MVPDTTVLINFAILHRMDLLGRLADGDGRWCATVATECAESARVAGLAALDGPSEIFGEPLLPDEAEHQDALVLRDGLVRPGDPPTKHFGEAETHSHPATLPRGEAGLYLLATARALSITAQPQAPAEPARAVDQAGQAAVRDPGNRVFLMTASRRRAFLTSTREGALWQPACMACSHRTVSSPYSQSTRGRSYVPILYISLQTIILERAVGSCNNP
jgi:hypothetical protein